MNRSLRPDVILVTSVAQFGDAKTLERSEVWCRRFERGKLMIQLRDNELPAAERLHVGRALRALTFAYGQLFVVNDRLDLALLLKADGVHLGESSVTALDARSILGGDVWISRACHSPATASQQCGCSALLVSPIFAERKGKPALGLEGLRAALKSLRACPSATSSERIPAVYALGGATMETRDACQRVGADGIAMIGGAWET